MKHIYGFLNTHPLWTKEQFGLQQFEMPEIDLSTFVSQPIPEKLRLGHQVEYIFKQLLEHSNAYKVLAHNIQIKKGNTTIGEFDFILERVCNIEEEEDRFRESKKNLLHVELTCKFYIIDPSISEPIHRLMGPNRKDMFFTKMEKTRDAQMPLAFSLEGKSGLSTLGIDADALVQQTYFMGQLFVPYGTERPSIRPLNTNCICGFWIKFDAFNTAVFKEFKYYIPFKHEWLHEPHLDVSWKNHYDTLMDINIRLIDERSPMVWIRKVDDRLEKCFVVWW